VDILDFLALYHSELGFAVRLRRAKRVEEPVFDGNPIARQL
jgi:hypothetical protein